MLEPDSVRLPVTVVNPGLAPIRSVPLLVKVPVPMFTPPPLTNKPLLAKEALPTRAKLAPAATVIVPALAANADVVDRLPVCTLIVPLFTKLVG